MNFNWFFRNFLGLQEQYRERDKITNKLNDRIRAAKEIGDRILKRFPFMLSCTLLLGIVFIGTISGPSQELSIITIFPTGICFLFFILVTVTGTLDIIKNYKIMSTLSRKLLVKPWPT